MNPDAYADEYRDALRSYTAEGTEAGLASAYDVGRRAMAAGCTILDVASMHQELVAELRGEDAQSDESQRATQFLLEVLAAFDLAQRGYWEAQAQARIQREAASQLERLTRAQTRVMQRSLVGERVREICVQAREIVGAERAVLTVLDEELERLAGGQRFADPVDADHSDSRAMVLSRRGRRDAGAPTSPIREDRWLAVALEHWGARAGAVLELWSGVDAPFTERDEEAVVRYAQFAALAIESARLYEHEHEIGLTLQRSLLPAALPRLEGVSLATRYVPAAIDARVGGDWYDAAQLDDGRILLTVGDVMGHSLEAAIVMGKVRQGIHAYLVGGEIEATLFEWANSLLCEVDEYLMATLVAVELDLERGTATVTNAGHPDPLLCDGTSARFLEGERAFPLGLRSDWEEPAARAHPIERGSTLLLYSDGLIDIREHDILERVAMMRTVCGEFAGKAEDLCDLVLDKLLVEPVTDDVCLLAAHID